MGCSVCSKVKYSPTSKKAQGGATKVVSPNNPQPSLQGYVITSKPKSKADVSNKG